MSLRDVPKGARTHRRVHGGVAGLAAFRRIARSQMVSIVGQSAARLLRRVRINVVLGRRRARRDLDRGRDTGCTDWTLDDAADSHEECGRLLRRGSIDTDPPRVSDQRRSARAGRAPPSARHPAVPTAPHDDGATSARTLRDARVAPFVVGFYLVPEFALMSFAAAIEPLRSANRLHGDKLYDWRLFSRDGR